jgi:glycosyltransferase involved in cell wall biosynthesis
MNNGISFMVRVRNEEKTLEASIRSLFFLTIPHEINIFLHRCTDNSENIVRKLAEENKNIRVFIYSNKVSRAGYETLATDSNSEHSLTTYYNYCFNQRTMFWSFKWDADFIASPPLVDFLNSKEWTEDNICYVITYKSPINSAAEIYLSCSGFGYSKYLFWETIVYKASAKIITLDDSIFINHVSVLSDIKSYWYEEPWYLTEDSEEAKIVKTRIEMLEKDYGKEPIGMARALNPESGPANIRILQDKPTYVNINS